MNITRRKALTSALFGAGYIGLRALATGIPASVLLKGRRASADSAVSCANKSKAQFIVLATSSNGDPINANVPGTYEDTRITHSADPAMAPTAMKLGSKATTHAGLGGLLAAARESNFPTAQELLGPLGVDDAEEEHPQQQVAASHDGRLDVDQPVLELLQPGVGERVLLASTGPLLGHRHQPGLGEFAQLAVQLALGRGPHVGQRAVERLEQVVPARGAEGEQPEGRVAEAHCLIILHS